jgi:hypothetical protein
MWEALRNFLDVIADSAQSLRHFREDQELRRTAEALYVAMLRMVEACINSLVHESLCKFAQSNPNTMLILFSGQVQIRLQWRTTGIQEKATPGDCG